MRWMIQKKIHKNPTTPQARPLGSSQQPQGWLLEVSGWSPPTSVLNPGRSETRLSLGKWGCLQTAMKMASCEVAFLPQYFVDCIIWIIGPNLIEHAIHRLWIHLRWCGVVQWAPVGKTATRFHPIPDIPIGSYRGETPVEIWRFENQ